MTSREEILTQIFDRAHISLREAQIGAFLRYGELLEAWNAKMNLTAITDFQEVALKHFLDSVYPFVLKGTAGDLSLVDVGSGAGFPGIPLKILFPEMNITLLDSLNKRIGFLNEVIDRLGLTKIRALHGRAEDLGRVSGLRDSFNLATARAVAPLNVLAEYCLPFVKAGGVFYAYKSESGETELQSAASACGALKAKPLECLEYDLPGSEYKRSVILIQKTAPTPAVYPRRAGTARKKPL
ncbi:MAG: 16S rRNA (guanine(527)-N(7))-methyltransferase RsmG [Lachnospiraceae bacterium]|nr:16S rRNA (guanine(527)-N(7))-methyltransferase RsmG [Lachnospiraceae bacterium]